MPWVIKPATVGLPPAAYRSGVAPWCWLLPCPRVSITSWAAIFRKYFALNRVKSLNEAFEREFWSGRSIDEMDERAGDRPRDALSRVYAAAAREWREARGQVLRLMLAPLGALLGRIPLGNTGRASVSAFVPMSIPEELRHVLGQEQRK